MNELAVLERRLNLIGIKIELMGNVPWVYLTKVNGNTINKSDFTANHGFVIAWNRNNIELVSNRKSIFEIIRKYR